MRVEGCQFQADSVSRFFNSIRVSGWFFHPGDELSRVELDATDKIAETFEVGLPNLGVSLAENTGWYLQILLPTNAFPAQANLVFSTRGGKVVKVKLADLNREGLFRKWNEPLRLFEDALSSPDSRRVLDLGGRDRSQFDRKQIFPGKDVVVFDIHESENVDVVGDAHALSDHFPPDHFDAVMSTSVFEHLLMPWKVATEIAKVLKPGGVAFVHTHQTVGMHDIPWDFWRFSNTSWDALFNKSTGFEVVSTAMGQPMFIIPFFWRDEFNAAERAAGFGSSTLLARKIGQPTVHWDVKMEDVISTSYPKPTR